MTQRRYSESEKATALALLAAHGGNIKRTADELGIPQTTLRDWANGDGINPDVTERRDQKKEELDALFERVARAYMEHSVSPSTIKKVKGKDAVIAGATALDKVQLLRGKPTAITKHDLGDLSDDDLDRELAATERARTALETREESAVGTSTGAGQSESDRLGSDPPASPTDDV